MFNMRGELIGIVNSKSFGTGIEGLGFAIPVNKAISVSEELMTKGHVSGKPMIGVSFEDVSNDAGSLFFFGGTPSNVKPGVYVRSLIEGMNDKVLKEGDRIIAVNGDEIGSSEDIKAAVSAASIGDKLTFQLYRDGKLMEVKVSVYERTPEIMAAASSDPEEKKSDPDEGKNLTTKPAIGVSMQEVNNGFAKEGVYVTALEEGMNDKVLQVGDRIVAVNGDEINSVSDVKSIVENAKIGDKLNFQVSREGKLISVEVTVFEKTVDAEEDAPAKEDETPSESDGFSGFGDLSEFFERFFG
jgi:S1-C subfamily serine protease